MLEARTLLTGAPEAAATQAADIAQVIGDPGPQNLIDYNGVLYFTGTVDDQYGYGGFGGEGGGGISSGVELWTYDGETATIVEGATGAQDLTVFDDGLYYTAPDGDEYGALWKFDGATSVRIADAAGGSFSQVQGYRGLDIVDGAIYFEAYKDGEGYELWTLDGGSSTATMIDVNPGTGSSSPEQFTSVDGTLFFEAYKQGEGYELWKYNDAGLTMIDVNPGDGSAYPYQFTDVSGTLYFTAFDGAGTQLFEYDGFGVSKISLETPRASSHPDQFTAGPGGIFFTADDGVTGRELWVMDPDGANARQVADLNPGPGDSYIYEIVTTADGLFFTVYDGTKNSFLRYDGDGLTEITVYPNNQYNSAGGQLTTVNGRLYFVAREGATFKEELWTWNGSAAVKIEPNGGEGFSEVDNLTDVNGELFFTNRHSQTGENQLWKYDGVDLTMIDLQSAGVSKVYLYEAVGVGETIYFEGRNSETGYELVKYDGENVTVIDVYPGSQSSYPYDLTDVDGNLYFTAEAEGEGEELWKYDGAELTLITVNPGPDNSYPYNLTDVNGTLFFTAYSGPGQDGQGNNVGEELWSYDGTELTLFDLNPGPDSSYLYDLKVVGGNLYFTAYTSDGGQGGFGASYKLFVFDGQTVAQADFGLGPEWTDFASLTDVGGVLFFTAVNQTIGESSLWSWDGETTQNYNLNVGSNYFYGSESLTVVDGVLYVSANDGLTGYEPWVVDLNTDPLPLDFGDAPNSYGTTLNADVTGGGARHVVVQGFHLGTAIDAEEDGAPSADALGDDQNGLDDDEGIVIPAIVINENATTVKGHVTATLGETPGMLDAWIDYNDNGVFEAAEHIFAGQSHALTNGFSEYTFTVPSLAGIGGVFAAGVDQITTYARFRLSSTGDLDPTGFAGDGEVQDYAVTILKGTSSTGKQQSVLNGALASVLSSPELVNSIGDKDPTAGGGVVLGDAVTNDMNDAIVEYVQLHLDEFGDNVENIVVFWVDPVDMIVTDAAGNKLGFVDGNPVNEIGSNAVIGGDGNFGIAMIVNANPSTLNVEFAGTGGSLRAGTNNVTRTSTESQTFSGGLLAGSSVALALDFSQPAGGTVAGGADAVPVISTATQTTGSQSDTSELFALATDSSGVALTEVAFVSQNNQTSVDAENVSDNLTAQAFRDQLDAIRSRVDKDTGELVDSLDSALDRFENLDDDDPRREKLHRALRTAWSRIQARMLDGEFTDLRTVLRGLLDELNELLPESKADDGNAEPNADSDATTQTESANSHDDSNGAEVTEIDAFTPEEYSRAVREAVEEILRTASPFSVVPGSGEDNQPAPKPANAAAAETVVAA